MSKRQAATRSPQRSVHTKNLLPPLPATLAALGLLLVLPGGVPSAQAATPTVATAPPIADQDAATADLVQRLVLDRAASLARVQKKADEREQQLLDQLENKDRKLRRTLKEAQEGGRQTAQLRAELADVTAERERLVAGLIERDGNLKTELAEYRRIINELANSPSPERREALEIYANGNRVDAFRLLQELTKSEELSAKRAINLRIAARYREQATLANEMRHRKDPNITKETELKEWIAAAKYDPNDSWTWISIAYIYNSLGNYDESIESAEKAVKSANTQFYKYLSLIIRGQSLAYNGKFLESLHDFQDALSIKDDSIVATDSEKIFYRLQLLESIGLTLEKLYRRKDAAAYYLQGFKLAHSTLSEYPESYWLIEYWALFNSNHHDAISSNNAIDEHNSSLKAIEYLEKQSSQLGPRVKKTKLDIMEMLAITLWKEKKFLEASETLKSVINERKLFEKDLYSETSLSVSLIRYAKMLELLDINESINIYKQGRDVLNSNTQYSNSYSYKYNIATIDCAIEKINPIINEDRYKEKCLSKFLELTRNFGESRATQDYVLNLFNEKLSTEFTSNEIHYTLNSGLSKYFKEDEMGYMKLFLSLTGNAK